MKDYVFETISADSEHYSASVEFALQVYESALLHPVRQAFPYYVCMSRGGRLLAVCGFRSAASGLMLEQFMEDTACTYIARHEGITVSRDAIVELGAFRVRSPALTPLFSRKIEAILVTRGFSHALALSQSGAQSVAQWTKERTSMADAQETGASQGAAALMVGVIPLTGNG